MIKDNVPSNWAILSHRLKFLPITTSNCGWCINVVNHRFTFWKGCRNCGSRTCTSMYQTTNSQINVSKQLSILQRSQYKNDSELLFIRHIFWTSQAKLGPVSKVSFGDCWSRIFACGCSSWHAKHWSQQHTEHLLNHSLHMHPVYLLGKKTYLLPSLTNIQTVSIRLDLALILLGLALYHQRTSVYSIFMVLYICK